MSRIPTIMKINIALISALTLAAGIPLARAQSSTKDVTLFGSNRVAAAFAKGMPLLETSAFKIHASRRDAPGVAEIHTRDTDIVHVLEGSATLVIGGTATQQKTVAPNEIRGKDLQGGEIRRSGKADVIVIPN